MHIFTFDAHAVPLTRCGEASCRLITRPLILSPSTSLHTNYSSIHFVATLFSLTRATRYAICHLVQYAAYLILNVRDRAYGVEFVPSKVSVTVGKKVQRGRAYLGCKDEKKCKMENLFYRNRRYDGKRSVWWGR
ncbi:hypothetical protein VNO80_29784 [Phaseolus coccineus]|uniref:Uncharacterized protein n=1 Tax=Phaseolus coccineus TaxID=3886 RepID=A0AAN9LF04_PHACN